MFVNDISVVVFRSPLLQIKAQHIRILSRWLAPNFYKRNQNVFIILFIVIAKPLPYLTLNRGPCNIVSLLRCFFTDFGHVLTHSPVSPFQATGIFKNV